MGFEPKRCYMERAIELARKGGGWVNPNPQVGCVIVSDDEVRGEGYHAAFGRLHAERVALGDCIARGCDARGATVYVTLEPCAHEGKTPPCADALIEAAVGRVVVGSADPNPLVAGQGIARLRDAGIEVICGFMEEACDALNEPFFHYIATGRPLVIAKYAMTLDGKFATRTGKSRWITGAQARQRVHEDRSRYAAIMVGVGTVIADDPMLNVRLSNAGEGDATACQPHQPARVVVDTNLRTPLESQLVQTASAQRTIIVTCVADDAVRMPFLERGCELLTVCAGANGRIDLCEAMAALGEVGLDSVVLEGGDTLMAAAFDAHIVDKVQVYLAPKVFAGIDNPSEATIVHDLSVERIDDDILLEGAV